MTPNDPDSRPDLSSVHELAGAHALDALPGDERESFEAHLATCDDCANEVASLREVTTNLALLAADEAPPPALRSAVLGAITDLQQVPAGPDAPASPRRGSPRGPDVPARAAERWDAPTPSNRTAQEPDHPRGEVVSLDEHRRVRRLARVVTGVAAALALVAGGVGLWASDLDQQLRGRDQATQQVASVLNAPDVQIQSVDGSSLVLSPGQQQAVFTAGDARAPDSSSVLQLWVIDDEGPKPAGLVDNPDEPALLDIPVPDGVMVGVTVEPTGGSDQPTTDPVVVFET